MPLNRNLRNVPRLQATLKRKPEFYWNGRGRDMALTLFHDMAERVPAYKDFLKQHQINHKDIRTIQDFESLPLMDKDNYLRKYPREALCWDGKFNSKQWVVSATSGSTGEPFYFPRTELQDDYYAISAELYLRENFKIQERSTLYVDAFAMGIWIGGVFTYEAIRKVAKKGYKLSVITPGIHKQEVLNSVRKLGEEFDQVIIGCYPPMMKDIIDLGNAEEIDWARYNIKFVFSAEGFGEQFRDHVMQAAGVKNVYMDSLNHYGTVDIGTMGHETPSSILIRRKANENTQLFHDLFGTTRKQPTFIQYLPEMFYFEEIQGGLICTSDSGFPLIRYDLKDSGGLISGYKIAQKFQNHGMKLGDELKKADIADTVWNIPYLYLFERSDFSVTLVGGNIYPEEIRVALLHDGIKNKITGKFTMEVEYDRNMDPKLVIHIELTKGAPIDKQLARTIQRNIVATLLEHNSEYVSNYKAYGRRLWPRIVMWPYEHELHFHGRGKQKWVKK